MRPYVGSNLDWTEMHGIVGSCVRPGGLMLTERALEFSNLPFGSLIADIGCGAGGTLEHLEQKGVYHVIGLDNSDALLGNFGSSVLPKQLVMGVAENLPFKKDTFDALFCECVLSIISDRVAALHEFARVLKKGGVIILSDIFGQVDPWKEKLEEKSLKLKKKGFLEKKSLLDFLTGLGFSLLLWEDNKKVLQEFTARMILAGNRLPDLWRCTGEQGEKVDRTKISYFLLVARKSEVAIQPVKSRGDG